MTGHVRIAFLLSLFAPAACAENVRISWVGQSCFYIQTENGPTVVTDPPVASVGYALPATPADAVTVSHNHTDHNNSAGVKGAFALIDGRPVTARTEAAGAGMRFILIPGFHDNTNGAARGQNTMVRWTQGGVVFAHLGDYGQDSLADAQLADLGGIDVLIVPAGGFYTIDNQQAAALIRQLNPRVAILMHFRTGLGGPAQLAAAPGVAAPFASIRYKPSTVTVSPATLPAATEVWLMEPVSDFAAVNAAAPVAGVPSAPQSLVSIFGSFTGSGTAQYGGVPLPRKLGETEVVIGNEAAPLLYVSAGQINFQVPGRLSGQQAAVEVHVGGQRVARGTVTVVPRAPGLFAAVDQNGRAGRVRRGEYVTVWGTGQGAVAPAVADGAPGPDGPYALSTAEPAVFFGGRRAAVSFSGLAPAGVGLWQINAQVPQDAPAGPADLVVLFDSNLMSNPLRITIE